MMRLMIGTGILLTIVLIVLTWATGTMLYKIWSHSQPAPMEREARATLSLKAAKEEFDRGNVLFIDARGPSSYETGHIPGALYLPAEASANRRREALAPYPPGTQVITYCDGTGCRSSDILARKLSDDEELNLGDIHVFAGGFPAWEKAGYPIATGKGTEP